MKRIWIHRIIVGSTWLAVSLFLILTLAFTESKNSDVVCKDITIRITDQTGYYFVEDKDVSNILKAQGYSFLGKRLDTLPLSHIEQLLRDHPSVLDAQVYTTMDGQICIDISQRKPIIRIITSNNEGYYIDENGKLMPLSGKYTARLLVANGNISEQFSPGRLSVDAETSDTVVLATQTILDDLYLLADFIQNDDFWKAYVEQVYINQKQEIEMIPKLGSFVILLGTIEGYQTKFRNLRAFLETGLSREGWNKYSYINLKYNNQVVCTKSEVYDVQE